MNENMQQRFQKAAETHRVNIQRSLHRLEVGKPKGMKPDSPAASRNELLQLNSVGIYDPSLVCCSAYIIVGCQWHPIRLGRRQPGLLISLGHFPVLQREARSEQWHDQ